MKLGKLGPVDAGSERKIMAVLYLTLNALDYEPEDKKCMSIGHEALTARFAPR